MILMSDACPIHTAGAYRTVHKNRNNKLLTHLVWTLLENIHSPRKLHLLTLFLLSIASFFWMLFVMLYRYTCSEREGRRWSIRSVWERDDSSIKNKKTKEKKEPLILLLEEKRSLFPTSFRRMQRRQNSRDFYSINKLLKNMHTFFTSRSSSYCKLSCI